MKEHARHTLFCGTRVIQTRYIGSEQVLAVVVSIWVFYNESKSLKILSENIIYLETRKCFQFLLKL